MACAEVVEARFDVERFAGELDGVDRRTGDDLGGEAALTEWVVVVDPLLGTGAAGDAAGAADGVAVVVERPRRCGERDGSSRSLDVAADEGVGVGAFECEFGESADGVP